MSNTKVTQHVIANNAITADQLASAAVTDAKLHSTLDLSSKTLTLPATAIPSASTATTQAASDNSTKLATTAYVTTAIGNLVDSAPTALDTLNELAAALGDDANFSGTITTSLASKLPLAGGTMTGNIVLSGAPTSGLHPATKTYTDTADALKLNLSGGTLTGDLILNTTTALKIPVGTTGQRPSAATGQIRWNTTDGAIEVYNGTAWTAVGTGSSNKVLDTFTGDNSTTTFTLSITPANEDAIMVFIDGAYQEKGDYVLTNNSLALGTAPLSGEKIAVHTTTAAIHDGTTALNQAFTGDGSTTDFTLSQDPKSENNTQIYINGVYQQKTDYTVTGTTLAFDTAPDTGDIIEVNMFTVATLGNTDTVNEGVSNLYHTTARARGAISVSGNAISYNSSTGVITSAYEESPTFTGNVNITGDLDVGAADSNNAVMKLSANTGNWVFTNVQSNRNLEISDSDGTGTVLTIDTSGNVGIGTSTPTYLLDMESTTTGLTHNLKLNKSSTTGDYAEIAFQLWDGAGTGLNTFGGSGDSRPSVVLRAVNEATNSAAGAFVVGTFTGGASNSTLTEKFRIASDGNVGIGAAAVNRKLEIAGNNNGGAKANYIRITDTDTSATLDNQQGGIEFYTNDNTPGIAASLEVVYAGSGGGGEITLNTAAHSSAGVLEAMRIDASGNVGIGTNNPYSKLTVANTGAGDGSNIADFIGSDTNQRLIITNFLCGSNEDRVGFIWENQGVALWRNWMDDNGNLRLKSSNPSSSTDGKRIVTTESDIGRTIIDSFSIGNVASTSGDFQGGAGVASAGIQKFNFSIQGDNTWRTVLTNVHDCSFEMSATVGDAASRDNAGYSGTITSPAYGVSAFNNIYYHNGGWNTGVFEFRVNSAGIDYDIQCRFSSHYSTTNVASGFLMFKRLY